MPCCIPEKTPSANVSTIQQLIGMNDNIMFLIRSEFIPAMSAAYIATMKMACSHQICITMWEVGTDQTVGSSWSANFMSAVMMMMYCVR